MRKISNKSYILRIIDANINRAIEGMRVCEEVTRFILNSPGLSRRIKSIRHRLSFSVKEITNNKLKLLKQRQSLSDVGRKTTAKEMQRKDYKDIFFANLSRAKESLRVLEEFSKLINGNISLRLKKLRFEVYDFEKKVAKKL